jgi:uncharacterized membrane protein
MRKILLIFIVALIAVYPFAIYFGLHYFSPRYLALIIALIFICRFFVMGRRQIGTGKWASLAIIIVGIGLCLWAMVSNNALTIRLYPVAINITFLIVFMTSWFFPPTIIERFARITTPDLPPAAIKYTRVVTLVWSCFFVINASIALYTALFCSLKVWTFYNGFLSYFIIGLLFVIEFIVRKIVQRKIADV